VGVTYQLTVSDISGGNAVLFLAATLLSGKAVLPQAQNTDIYLTALAIPSPSSTPPDFCSAHRRLGRMGLDSLVVLSLYILGLAGLFAP
jgi:cation:H+ antiporter